MLLHDGQELDDDLGRRTDEDLSLSTLFGVVDVVKTIVQDGNSDHFRKSKGNRRQQMVKRQNSGNECRIHL